MRRIRWILGLSVLGLLLTTLWFVSQKVALFSGQSYMTRTMYQYIEERLEGEPTESIQQSAGDRIKMLALARKEGLFNDPSIQYAMDDLVILKLRQHLDKQKAESPPDGVLESHFKKNAEKYRKPEQRRIAVVRRALQSGQDDQMFQDELKLFKTSLSAGKLNPGHGFGQVASRYSSHRRSRLAGGDLGWLGKDSDRDLPVEVNQAIWNLSDEEEIATVELEDAIWYVVMSGHREAVLPEFRLVKKRVLYDYFLEQRDMNDQHWKAQWSLLPVFNVPEL